MFDSEQKPTPCSETQLMSTKKPDRRIARTRELALDAFRKLMLDRGFERITVQHVLDRAGIGRATFYAHFRSKQDLLTASIARLQAGLRAAWREEARHNPSRTIQPLGFSLRFLQHLDSHRRIYDMMIGKSSEVTLDRHMRRMLAELCREDLLGRPGAQRNDQLVEVGAQFASGALWSLTVWWLSTRARLTPEQLDAVFRQLVFRGLEGTPREFCGSSAAED